MYKHINTKGQTYFLNAKNVTLKGGREVELFYFSKDQRETAADLPEDREVSENPRTGMLFLKKKK